jgi:hypothetical protein
MRNLHQSLCTPTATEPCPGIKRDVTMADTRSRISVSFAVEGVADPSPCPAAEPPLAVIRSRLYAVDTAQAVWGPPASVGDACVAVAAAAVARWFDAELVVNAPLWRRWCALRQALVSSDAGVFTEWSAGTWVTLRPARPEADHVQPPTVLDLSSTVFASGHVACAIDIEGLEAPLWLVNLIHLNRFEQLENIRK